MIICQANRLSAFFNVRSKAIFLATFILCVDLLTKYWTQHDLPMMYSHAENYPYGGIGVFKNLLGIEFSITHAINYGAAWGILHQHQFSLLIFRLLLVILLSIYAFFINKQAHQRLPLTLIIAGATGNIIDYFLYGHVIDMFNFIFWGYPYPVFNVADSAITLGILGLLVQNWRHQPVEKA